jgi:hypothetical protein
MLALQPSDATFAQTMIWMDVAIRRIAFAACNMRNGVNSHVAALSTECIHGNNLLLRPRPSRL